MIDDSPVIHFNIKNGYKLLSGIPDIVRILFTGDTVENDTSDGAIIANTWELVYNICSKITHTHTEDDLVITKYVYPEFSDIRE